MNRRVEEAMRAYYARDQEALRRILEQPGETMSMSEQKDVVLSIARVAHEVNRAYCASLGDHSQPIWESASNELRHSAFVGVKMHLENPKATPEDSHKSWMAQKEKDGWVYGEVKDTEKKTHPCMVPYAELPEQQRAKDFIFRGIVHAIAHELSRPA